MENREELRKRLREKLKGKRDTRHRGGSTDGGGRGAPSLQKVEELVLHTFGNDPDALRTATEAMRDPQKLLRELSAAEPARPAEYSDDEEAPPVPPPS